jgi:uncharacterized protein
MVDIDSFGTGEFCWVDLTSPDVPASVDFYSALFGWEPEELDVPDSTYVNFRVRGRLAAGVVEPWREEGKAGPHWNCYVSVDDAEQYAKRAEAAGGTIVMNGLDIDDDGRMAVIADPAGGVLRLWEPKAIFGAEIAFEPNSFTWFELMSADPGAAAPFYSDLFGWRADVQPMPEGDYTVFYKDGKQACGLLQAPPGTPKTWMPYFHITDTDGFVDRAEDLGARVSVDPENVPDIGRFAVMTDPLGAMFAVITPFDISDEGANGP